jgi:hypothetical protein
MSDKKHETLLAKIWAHPIAHNIEWSELIPALESIGVTYTEKNGGHHFTRAGRTIVLGAGRTKTLDTDEVMKLRHFLDQEMPEDSEAGDAIVAIDHHHATIFTNPGTAMQSQVTLHANLTDARHVHGHPTTAPFTEVSPLIDHAYFATITDKIAKSNRIVLLSHGTGTSNAANQYRAVLDQSNPEIASRIVANQVCDLEAMTDPQLIQLGLDLIGGVSQ